MNTKVECLIEKDGHQQIVSAQVGAMANGNVELVFPTHLYEGDGFTLIGIGAVREKQ